MLGPRLNTVFASRWKALWWAAVMLLTAYCTIPRQGEDNAAAIVPGGLVEAAPAAGAAGGGSLDEAQRASAELRAIIEGKDASPATAAPSTDDAWGKDAAKARHRQSG